MSEKYAKLKVKEENKMKKQYIVEIEYEETQPELVTDVAVEVCIENMMNGYVDGLIKDGWTVDVTEVN